MTSASKESQCCSYFQNAFNNFTIKTARLRGVCVSSIHLIHSSFSSCLLNANSELELFPEIRSESHADEHINDDFGYYVISISILE